MVRPDVCYRIDRLPNLLLTQSDLVQSVEKCWSRVRARNPEQN